MFIFSHALARRLSSLREEASQAVFKNVGVAGTAPVPAAVATKASRLSFQPVLVAAQAHIEIVRAQRNSEIDQVNLHSTVLLYYGNDITSNKYLQVGFRTQHVRTKYTVLNKKHCDISLTN